MPSWQAVILLVDRDQESHGVDEPEQAQQHEPHEDVRRRRRVIPRVVLAFLFHFGVYHAIGTAVDLP